MVKTNDLVMLLAVGVGTFAILKILKGRTTSNINVASGLQNAGLSNVKITKDGSVFGTAGNTTFKFNQGDFDKLNLAQKMLIGLDRIVPGSFITKAVLT